MWCRCFDTLSVVLVCVVSSVCRLRAFVPIVNVLVSYGMRALGVCCLHEGRDYQGILGRSIHHDFECPGHVLYGIWTCVADVCS